MSSPTGQPPATQSTQSYPIQTENAHKKNNEHEQEQRSMCSHAESEDDATESQNSSTKCREGSMASNSDEDEQSGTDNDVVYTSRSRGVASDVAVIKWAYRMVEECSVQQPHIISWTKEGDGFEVKDIEALEATILGKYFTTTKYTSFTRQLNKYGFKRYGARSIKKSDDASLGGKRDKFKHEYFQRGREDLLSQIKKKKPDGGNKKRSAAREEVEALRRELEHLAKNQIEIQRTIRSLQDTKVEQKTRIEILQKQDASKDEMIKSLEARVKNLEDHMFAVMGQQRRLPSPSVMPWDRPYQGLAIGANPFLSPLSVVDTSRTTASLPQAPTTTGHFYDIHNQQQEQLGDGSGGIGEEPTLKRHRNMKRPSVCDSKATTNQPNQSAASTAAHSSEAEQPLSRQSTGDSWLIGVACLANNNNGNNNNNNNNNDSTSAT